MEDDTIKKLFKKMKFYGKQSFIEILEDLSRYIETCECEKEAAINRMKKWNKDEEIVKLKEEIAELKKGISFTISSEEIEKINQWKERHQRTEHSMVNTTIGGRYTYIFTPTSIGDIGEIQCSCGKKFCFRELN